MDGYAVLLALALLVNSHVDGRSRRNILSERSSYGDHIVFGDEDIRQWQNSDETSEEWEHGNGYREPSKKRLRNWDPDRVWFPDFNDKDFSFMTSSTEAKEVTSTPITRNEDECIKECPTTSEYNPVCGTNRVTYNNIGHLDCARMCGVDVRVLGQLPCSLVFQETSTTESIQSLGEEQRQCMEACPATPEYNPICGTNDVTYPNRGRLECARFCGIDVEVKRLSPCPSPVSTESSASKDLLGSGQTKSTTTSSIFASSTVAPDKPNISIPQHILSEVFNNPIGNLNEEDINIRHGE